MSKHSLGCLWLVALILTNAHSTARAASFATLYSFNGGIDGGSPMAAVLIADGALYGTTYFGGSSGDGTVYQLTPRRSRPWELTVLHNFSSADGANCASNLVLGAANSLYGITTGGTLGTGDGTGALFELTPPAAPGGDWTETVLWTSGGNGTPNGSVTFGPGGALYVTTQGDITDTGVQYGTVDAVTPPSSPGGPSISGPIYNFEVPGGTGTLPLAGVVFDGDSLYGTDYYGGNFFACVYGCGVVYKLTPPGTPGSFWTGTAIYNFGQFPGDGAGSEANLTVGPNGVLYGTTAWGGAGTCSTDGGALSGCGTVFKLTPPSAPGDAWIETVLYSFSGLNGDGSNPVASVTLGSDGTLYGTTQNGGSAASDSICPSGSYNLAGCGTIFKLTPPRTPGGKWEETVLYSFSGFGDGSMPVAPLALNAAGVLYGTASSGGSAGHGTVFALTLK